MIKLFNIKKLNIFDQSGQSSETFSSNSSKARLTTALVHLEGIQETVGGHDDDDDDDNCDYGDDDDTNFDNYHHDHDDDDNNNETVF